MKFFPNTTGVAFNDPRLKLFFDDAAKYLRMEGKGQNYDVIICGSATVLSPVSYTLNYLISLARFL